VFLFVAGSVSFAKIAMIGDTEESHQVWKDLMDGPLGGNATDDSPGKTTQPDPGVGFDTPNDAGGASMSFTGNLNAGGWTVGFFGTHPFWADQLGGEAYIRFTRNPQAENEFRYMTLATSSTGEHKNATIGIESFPGFGHAAPGDGGTWIDPYNQGTDANKPSTHAQACWDNTINIGAGDSINWWKKPGEAQGGVAGNSFWTPINVDASGNTFGDLPVEWHFFVFDMAEKAAKECIYNADCQDPNINGWDWETWSYEADMAETGGQVFFDAFYVTQTAAEACGIGGLGDSCVDSITGLVTTSVDPGGKASTTWGAIKNVR
jgi:hypothetical protein